MKKIAIYAVCALALLVIVAKSISYASNRYSCHSKWVDSSIESKYTIRGGCLVNYKGDWIPSENFRLD